MSVLKHRNTRRTLAVTLGTLAVAALTYGGIALAPSALAATNVQIKGVASARCLTPAANNGQTTIQNCGTTVWSTTGANEITINGQCLDVKGALTANSTQVITWACNGGTNQKWNVNSDGTIRGVQSGRCLDVKGEATAAGSLVQIYDCHGGNNQKWQLVGGGTQPSPSSSTSTPPPGPETIGTGNINAPAQGPGPSQSVYGANFVLVKNWNFGAGGTIKNIADMNSEFYYHDQFGTIGNGSNYGAVTASPDSANALSGQPINTGVRNFTGDSIKTSLIPLNGATTVSPSQHNVVNGSFMAKWAPANGGSRLGRDILWETRVRYVTPREFWFALWNAGTKWDGGAELDVVESFGYDNGGGNTNFDGRYWHADPVGGTSTTNYSNWSQGMASRGITSYDATQYHTWALLYKKDNTYTFYVDGIPVQNGNINWTLGGGANGENIDFHFLFDAGWGHTQIASVNYPIPASELSGKYYEFDYSRVYLR